LAMIPTKVVKAIMARTKAVLAFLLIT
jgi:hypothetical protein